MGNHCDRRAGVPDILDLLVEYTPHHCPSNSPHFSRVCPPVSRLSYRFPCPTMRSCELVIFGSWNLHINCSHLNPETVILVVFRRSLGVRDGWMYALFCRRDKHLHGWIFQRIGTYPHRLVGRWAPYR